MTSWEGCVISHPKTGPAVDALGMTFAFRLTGKDTDGMFSITDQYALPGAGPAFLHAHPATETFIVLEGDFEIYGREHGKKVSARMGPGSIHHVASNAPHGAKNIGTTMGRVLLLFHPADLQEGVFKDLGKPTSAEAKPEPLRPGPPPAEVLQHWLKVFEKHKVALLEQPTF